MFRKITLAGAAAAMLFHPDGGHAGRADPGKVTDLSFTMIDGSAMPLSVFEGKVLLIVNTASFCGFTRHYQGLQALWERYERKGLAGIGVPSNDFNQEPDDEAKIASFCQVAFGVTFPFDRESQLEG